MSAIRKSAKGMECQVRLPGICNGDAATVVWSHANGSAAGKGIGGKSSDVLGAYACYHCHAAYDRALPVKTMSRDAVEVAWWEGHARSLQILVQKGLVAFK